MSFNQLPKLALLLVFLTTSLGAASPSVAIPRIEEAPRLEDFLEMKPADHWDGKLAKVEDFTQTAPKDGQPATQKTEVYLGYDQHRLYVIFVAFDNQPEKVRGGMSRRENIDNSDDWVEVALDTFNDQRRAYLFDCNPLGVQWDALHSEGTGENSSFDAVWDSQGRRTDRGFVVWMAIPFKSLRFPDRPAQEWGIQFRRWQSRIPELSTWPHVSSRIQGRLNQAALAVGLENVTPGRNLQLIPYGSFRSFRALDRRDFDRPRFRQVDGEFDGGLDAKWVIRDKLVLDATVNPDFSQVESDEPQVTANQRFEVFFPEKRPFFQENATFFETPIDLVFTRRIADPQFGVRMTGKVGKYALGAFWIDDQAPGRRVAPEDPLAGERAAFSIVRVSRDIFGQSTVGGIFTERRFQNGFNRVAGLDARLRLGRTWSTTLQAVTSETRSADGEERSGPAYYAQLQRNGRQFNLWLTYSDLGEDFRTETGFVNRTGIREVEKAFSYRFRPEGKFLIAWGPGFRANGIWDRSGKRLDWIASPSLGFTFARQTQLNFFWLGSGERLRPRDFADLRGDRDFNRTTWGIQFSSSPWTQLRVASSYSEGRAVNFVPLAGLEPESARQTRATLGALVRPITPLRIQNTYILSRLRGRDGPSGIFTNHIFRSNWNWQFDRRLSLRFILQYDTLLTNPARTQLETRKNLNADVLLTYLVHPGTALFVGYNSNSQNIELVPAGDRVDLFRPRDRLINDGRQLFVKLSYLFRF